MKLNSLMNLVRLAAISAGALLPGMACTYSATSPVVGAGGGYATVAVYTQPGCVWQAAESGGFVSIVSSRQGVGTGSVRVYVAPNGSRAARTAYVRGLVYAPNANFGTRSGGGYVFVFQSNVTEYGR